MVRFGLASVLAFLVGCGGGVKEKQCLVSSNCDLEVGGTCNVYEPSGKQWCQYPDGACNSGRRWSDFETGDGLSGVCVDDSGSDAGLLDASVTDAGAADAASADASLFIDAIPSPDAAPGDPKWGTAGLIESDNAGSATSPHVANFSGDATAVWQQGDGVRDNIWASRYTSGTGWAVAVKIEANNSSAAFPRVAMAASGSAIAVWMQDGSIWANRYVVGSGWGGALTIEAGATAARDPQVSIDTATGNAVAVWSQLSGTRFDIWANRYVAGTGWGTAEKIETDDLGNASSPQVAMNASGEAVAVWEQADGATSNLWANRYAGGWGTAEKIEAEPGFVGAPQVAADSSGNAIAVWDQKTGTRYDVWANRYVSGSGWGTAARIETNDSGDAREAQVAVQLSTGGAVAVWRQWDGMRHNVWGNAYAVGFGWGTATMIEASDNSAGAVQVGVDSSGNATAIWWQGAGVTSIWVNQFIKGTGWGTARLIETNNAGAAVEPQVAVDGPGNAAAVWNQSAGGGGSRTDIWVNDFR